MQSENRSVFLRRLKWIFSNSGIIALAFEHFLAMIPATILVPLLVNNSVNFTVIDMSLVLFTSGLGTIIFSLCSARIETDENGKKTVRRLPAYLGSSFAYIGLTIYLLQSQIGEGLAPDMAYLYVGWSYVFSGVLLILLSYLYKIKVIVKFFSAFLPATVIGPAISLIGLELSDTAVADSGIDPAKGIQDTKALTVSLTTLLVIILFSLIKRKIWKNAAIIIGMVVGYIVHIAFNGVTPIGWSTVKIFSVPAFRLPFTIIPPNLPRLFISVIPATLIVFTENIGRVTVINRMQQEDNADSQLFNSDSVKVMGKALFSHGCASAIATALGSVPNTIYAENIAVMGIHKNREERPEPDKFIKSLTNPFSVAPYWIAGILAILCSFLGVLQVFILQIPKPVIGGMELFLFGIISAPGIQLLVDQQVNYKKVSNQLVTAAVLITGVSGLSINFNWFEIKGMSLGLVVGFTLNAFVLLLKQLGILCDSLSMDEVLTSCITALQADKAKQETSVSITNSFMDIKEIDIENIKKVLIEHRDTCTINGADKPAELFQNAIAHSDVITLQQGKETLLIIEHTANRITLDIQKKFLPPDITNIYLNDYPDAIDSGNSGTDSLTIDLSRNISLHRVEALIKKMNVTS